MKKNWVPLAYASTFLTVYIAYLVYLCFGLYSFVGYNIGDMNVGAVEMTNTLCAFSLVNIPLILIAILAALIIMSFLCFKEAYSD